tara:strand:- start:68525 stop:69319 length:795 start_codon:yes stop_codon:yes gene_type:complete
MQENELDSILSNPHGDILLDEQEPTNEISISSNAKGLIILLHGWDMDKNYDPGLLFRPFVERVRQYFVPRGYIVFAPVYNTHESFKWAAKNIYQLIVNSQFPLNNVHVFGYSMGGLVARQLVVEGLSPKNVVTFCTPHFGTAAWIGNNALFNNGAMSMAAWSEDLKSLNFHPRDIQFRNRYQTIGLSYYADNAKTQLHNNDKIVEVTSAIMWGEANKPAKQIHWASYRIWGFGSGAGDPHGQAQCPPEIDPAYNLFVQLVNQTG